MTKIVHYDDRWMSVEERNALRAQRAAGPHVMSDIKPFRTQDGIEISSRSSLRAYEQRFGVKQVGNDMGTK
jgi:hypothetical protein